MIAPVSNINRLVEILNSLNKFIKNYAIFIYLIDTNYRLLWANNYIRDKFHLPRLSKKNTCYRLLWKSDQRCDDCPVAKVMEGKQVQRHVLQRGFTHASERVFLEIIAMPVLNSLNDIEGLLLLGIDVTPLERKQRELRQKEKLFLSVVDSSSDAIFIMNEQDRITSWNRGAQDIFGYTPKEILGKSVISLVPKELLELGELYYIQKELSSRGFIRNYETQRLHKNGRIIHVDLVSSVLVNEEGKPIGRSIMMKDISARKELELELRRTILELSKLNELNEILYTTYILDDILKIILIAITAGEGLKFNRAFLFLRNPLTDILEGHIAIGPASDTEAQRIWMELQDRIRTLKEIVKEYEVDLQGSDREINEIVRSIKVPCSEKDHILIQSLIQRKAFQVVKGKISQLTKYYFDINGQNLIDILGNDTFIIVPLYAKKEPLGIIIADNKFTRRDIQKDDISALRFFASQASMAIENAMLYDRLEDRIQELQTAYQKLETSSDRLVKAERLAAIGKMAASVAHEIRNPLVSVGGFARLLAKKLPGNEELHNYATIITQQVENLEYILNNILSIASPRKPKYSSFDIHTVLHQLLNIMDDILQKKKVKLLLNFQCKESLVLGDEKMIFQAILNVFKNALESLGHRRTLSLKTDCDRKYVRINLHDSGRGISKENLEKIYDPFFTTKTEGTGLGLAVVRQIIEDHRGKIEIYSKEKQGTTVQIFLPRSPRSPKRRKYLARKQKSS